MRIPNLAVIYFAVALGLAATGVLFHERCDGWICLPSPTDFVGAVGFLMLAASPIVFLIVYAVHRHRRKAEVTAHLQRKADAAGLADWTQLGRPPPPGSP